MTIAEVAAATGGRLSGRALPSLRLRGVVADSRTVRPGALFVALRGRKHDGHDFVAEALANGAVAALVERVPTDEVQSSADEGPPLVVVDDAERALRALAGHWRRKLESVLIAVSGSVGVRITAELCCAVLAQQMSTLAGEALERPDLHGALALLQLEQPGTRVVLALRWQDQVEIEQLLDVALPSCTVITNVQRTQLEPAELDRLAEHKSALVAALPAGGTVVLNTDDPRVATMGSRTTAAIIRFGLGAETDVRAENVMSHGLRGMSFDLAVASRRVHVRLPLIGLYVLQGALAAAAVGLSEGLELGQIAAGLQTASSSTRIVVATGLNGSRIVDDTTNANAESCLDALNLLAELEGRRVAVLGDMLGLGSQEGIDHAKVGSRAARVVHLLITVGARASIIAEEARRAGLSASTVFATDSNERAVELLRRHLSAGDVVLVKGSRGMGLDSVVQAIRLEG